MADDDDFMKHMGQVLDAGMKLKKVMIKRGITAARAPCPICGTGFLHGRLVGRKQHLHMQCDTRDCAFMME